MKHGKGLVVCHSCGCIKWLVFVFWDIFCLPCPKGLGTIQPFGLTLRVRPVHWIWNMIRILLDQVLYALGLDILFGIFAKIEGDICSSIFPSSAFYRKPRFAVTRPEVCLSRSMGFGHNLNLICDHEGWVEADAKLANQLICEVSGICVLGAVDKRFGTWACDRSKRTFHLFSGQAYAIITDSKRLRFLICSDWYIAVEHVCRIAWSKHGNFPFVDGIWSVRNQFAQEDLFLRVERVDYDIENLAGISFEPKILFGHRHPLFITEWVGFCTLFFKRNRGA